MSLPALKKRGARESLMLAFRAPWQSGEVRPAAWLQHRAELPFFGNAWRHGMWAMQESGQTTAQFAVCSLQFANAWVPMEPAQLSQLVTDSHLGALSKRGSRADLASLTRHSPRQLDNMYGVATCLKSGVTSFFKLEPPSRFCRWFAQSRTPHLLRWSRRVLPGFS